MTPVDLISRSVRRHASRRLRQKQKAPEEPFVFIVETAEIESASENGHSYESTVRSSTFDLNNYP